MDEDIGPSEKPFEFDHYPQRLLIALIIFIIFVCGVFGNGLVIFSVLASRRLRTVTNVFVVNLAFADFLVCLFSPATVIALASPTRWPFESDALCGIAATVVYVTIGVSLYNLASIAVNRWILITRPVESYQKVYGNRVVVVLWIAFLWLFPSILVMLPVFMGISRFGYNEKYHSCSDIAVSGGTGGDFEKIYDLVLLMGIFPLPTVLLIVCYWKIYKHVLKHAKRLQLSKEESDAVSMTDSKGVSKSIEDTGNLSEANSYSSLPRSAAAASDTDTEGTLKPTVSLQQKKKRRTKKKKKKTVKSNLSRRQVEITKNLFYVLCAFLVCITPYLILLVFDDDGPLAAFAPYAACCLMVNNCINWIIYATKHPHFKVVFRCILTGKWREIPEPAEWLRHRGEGSSSICPCC